MEYESYMRKALSLARRALSIGETPVGAVVVAPDGRIVGRGYNRTEAEDATCHAEIEAIRDASRALGSWRLDGCALVATMEPCPMCAGAIINSRIKSVVYGAKDSRMGSCGSVINLFMENYGRSPAVIGGVLKDDCAGILSEFFSSLR